MKRTSALGLLVSGGVVTVACNAIFGLDEGELDPTICADDAACDDADPCSVDRCVLKHCVSIRLQDVDAPNDEQTTGDCRHLRCDGEGMVEVVYDGEDLPEDDNECTDDLCIEGDPLNNPREGSRCTGGVCDANGACVECLNTADCVQPDPPNPCASIACDMGQCTPVYVSPDANILTDLSRGDCHRPACDGAGAQVDAVDDADVPDDSNECTDDACDNGEPSNPALPDATNACGLGDQLDCVSGQCVGCMNPTECGAATFCLGWSCDAAMICTQSYLNAGLPLPSQTDGDCLEARCDAMGLIQQAIFDSDQPNDSNACTIDSCSQGNQVFNDAVANTPCGEIVCDNNGNCVCDGDGSCVECNTTTHCPNSNECQLPSCSGHMCNFNSAPDGTVLMTQTPNDCRKRICTSGAVVNSVDNMDIPLPNGAYCTHPACMSGSPVQAPDAVGSGCSGGYCNGMTGSGSCVNCTFDWHCGSGSGAGCCGQTSGWVCMSSGACGSC